MYRKLPRNKFSFIYLFCPIYLTLAAEVCNVIRDVTVFNYKPINECFVQSDSEEFILLKCDISLALDCDQVMWSKVNSNGDVELISSNSTVHWTEEEGKYSVTGEFNLQIYKVTEEDATSYTCSSGITPRVEGSMFLVLLGEFSRNVKLKIKVMNEGIKEMIDIYGRVCLVYVFFKSATQRVPTIFRTTGSS